MPVIIHGGVFPAALSTMDKGVVLDTTHVMVPALTGHMIVIVIVDFTIMT